VRHPIYLRERAMIFIESEDALFRGSSRSFPKEVWSRKERKFVPYTGVTPKPIEWGNEISGSEAINMMMGAMPFRCAESFDRRYRGRAR
jgi:hypothetical protein